MIRETDRIGVMCFPWLPEGRQWHTMANNAGAAPDYRAHWVPLMAYATREDAEAAMRKHNDALTEARPA